IRHTSALRGDDELVTSARDRPADDLLRVSQSIDGRGVDLADPEVKCFVHRGNGVPIILASPSELPAGPADCPGSQPDPCKREPALPKLSCFHEPLPTTMAAPVSAASLLRRASSLTVKASSAVIRIP